MGEGLFCPAHSEHERGSQTTLTGTTEGAVGNNFCCHIHVCIRQDNRWVFRSTLRLHALSIQGGAAVDMSGNVGGTDERYSTDGRVVKDRVHRFGSALNHIDHTGWKP